MYLTIFCFLFKISNLEEESDANASKEACRDRKKLDFHQCFVLCRSEIDCRHRLRPGMDRLHNRRPSESRRLRKFRHHILLDSRWHCVFCWGERIS